MTIRSDSKTRIQVASLARQFRAKEITYEQFFNQLPDSQDPDVVNLVDLIEHEPQRGGWLGAPPKEHALYVKDIEDAITRLETS